MPASASGGGTPNFGRGGDGCRSGAASALPDRLGAGGGGGPPFLGAGGAGGPSAWDRPPDGGGGGGGAREFRPSLPLADTAGPGGGGGMD